MTYEIKTSINGRLASDLLEGGQEFTESLETGTDISDRSPCEQSSSACSRQSTLQKMLLPPEICWERVR